MILDRGCDVGGVVDRVTTKGGARLESLHQQRCLDPRLSKEGGGIAGEVGSGAMLRAVIVTVK